MPLGLVSYWRRPNQAVYSLTWRHINNERGSRESRDWKMELTNPNSISVFDSLRRRMMMPEPWTFTEPLKASNRWSQQMMEALKAHWPEYLMEAAELGLFMISACAFTVMLFHPTSPVAQSIRTDAMR